MESLEDDDMAFPGGNAPMEEELDFPEEWMVLDDMDEEDQENSIISEEATDDSKVNADVEPKDASVSDTPDSVTTQGIEKKEPAPLVEQPVGETVDQVEKKAIEPSKHAVKKVQQTRQAAMTKTLEPNAESEQPSTSSIGKQKKSQTDSEADQPEQKTLEADAEAKHLSVSCVGNQKTLPADEEQKQSSASVVGQQKTPEMDAEPKHSSVLSTGKETDDQTPAKLPAAKPLPRKSPAQNKKKANISQSELPSPQSSEVIPSQKSVQEVGGKTLLQESQNEATNKTSTTQAKTPVQLKPGFQPKLSAQAKLIATLAQSKPVVVMERLDTVNMLSAGGKTSHTQLGSPSQLSVAQSKSTTEIKTDVQVKMKQEPVADSSSKSEVVEVQSTQSKVEKVNEKPSKFMAGGDVVQKSKCESTFIETKVATKSTADTETCRKSNQEKGMSDTKLEDTSVEKSAADQTVVNKSKEKLEKKSVNQPAASKSKDKQAEKSTSGQSAAKKSNDKPEEKLVNQPATIKARDTPAEQLAIDQSSSKSMDIPDEKSTDQPVTLKLTEKLEDKSDAKMSKDIPTETLASDQSVAKKSNGKPEENQSASKKAVENPEVKTDAKTSKEKPEEKLDSDQPTANKVQEKPEDESNAKMSEAKPAESSASNQSVARKSNDRSEENQSAAKKVIEKPESETGGKKSKDKPEEMLASDQSTVNTVEETLEDKSDAKILESKLAEKSAGDQPTANTPEEKSASTSKDNPAEDKSDVIMSKGTLSEKLAIDGPAANTLNERPTCTLNEKPEDKSDANTLEDKPAENPDIEQSAVNILKDKFDNQSAGDKLDNSRMENPAEKSKSEQSAAGKVKEKLGISAENSGNDQSATSKVKEKSGISAEKSSSDQSATNKLKDRSDKPADRSSSDQSASKQSGKSNNNKSNSRPDRVSNRSKLTDDDRASSKSERLGSKTRENLRRRSFERKRPRSHSRERNSRDRTTSRYRRTRSNERNPRRAGEKRGGLEKKKSDSSVSAANKEVSSASLNKSAETSEKSETVLSKEVTDKKKYDEEKTVQKKLPATKKINKESADQHLQMEPNTMEQGLWRFSLKLSPLELSDLGKQDLRTLLNTAQDCAMYFRNQGQNKKKKGESHLYFNRMLTTKCFMQKIFQLQLSNKKIEIEIVRKLIDSADKDTVTLELNMMSPGSLASSATASKTVTKSAVEENIVHISNVPKSTTQELLFVVFPTAHSILMPRDGKDKGTAILRFRNAQSAGEIINCYSSVFINKTKLKLVQKVSQPDKSASDKGKAEKVSDAGKKATESSKKKKTIKSNSKTDATSHSISEFKDKAQSEGPKEHHSVKVFQIPVLNKRASESAPNNVPSKRPKLDSAKPKQAQTQAQRFNDYNVPASVPPQTGMAAGVMGPAYKSGFPGPVSNYQGMNQPPWPPNINVTGILPDMSVPPPMSSNWQMPQPHGFKPDNSSVTTPKWIEDTSHRQHGECPQDRSPGYYRSHHATGSDERYRVSDRRSSSPSRLYSSRSYSPRRSQHYSRRSPEKSHHSSHVHLQYSQRHSRSPARRAGSRRLSRSPQPSSRQNYSPVSQGRLSQSPKRRMQQDHGDYSPVSQGRLSRSPVRRVQSPRMRVQSPGRPGRHAQSPGRRAQSPGRRAQSPGRRAQSPGRRAQSPGRRAQSPGRRAQSPGRRAQSPGRRAQSPGRRVQSPGRRTQSPGRRDYSPVRQAESPGRQMHRQTHSTRMRTQIKECRVYGVDRCMRSPGRKDYSPGRREHSPRRKGHSAERQILIQKRGSQVLTQDSRSYSPISQGRLSHSPDSLDQSPGRDVHRQAQTTARHVNRSFSPVSQGRLSRSPERRVVGGYYSPRKRSYSPQKRRTSPGHDYSPDRINLGLVHQSHSLARKSYPSPTRSSHHRDRQSTDPQSRYSSKQSSSPGRHSAGQAQNRRNIGSIEISKESERWTASIRLTPPSSSVPKEPQFPQSSSSVLFPSAANMAIPGLDLLLKATADKKTGSESKSKNDGEKSWLTSSDNARDSKDDLYQRNERTSSRSVDRDELQREGWSDKQDSSRDWWRGEKSGSKETDSSARDGQDITKIKSGRDLMNLRHEAAKHLAGQEKTSSARVLGVELNRNQDINRAHGIQGTFRSVGDSVGSTEFKQAAPVHDSLPGRETTGSQNVGHGVRNMGESRLPLKPAIINTASQEWNRGSDHSGLTRANWEGNNPLGSEESWGAQKILAALLGQSKLTPADLGMANERNRDPRQIARTIMGSRGEGNNWQTAPGMSNLGSMGSVSGAGPGPGTGSGTGPGGLGVGPGGFGSGPSGTGTGGLGAGFGGTGTGGHGAGFGGTGTGGHGAGFGGPVRGGLGVGFGGPGPGGPGPGGPGPGNLGTGSGPFRGAGLWLPPSRPANYSQQQNPFMPPRPPL